MPAKAGIHGVPSDAALDAALDPSFRWGDGIGEIVTILGTHARVSQEQIQIHQRLTTYLSTFSITPGEVRARSRQMERIGLSLSPC